MTLINSRALKQDRRPPMAALNIAAKDVIRRNDLGQMVLVVPKGQPIPEGLKVSDEEKGVKKARETHENKADTGRPTPKSSSKR
jgi:hypothetical protein